MPLGKGYASSVPKVPMAAKGTMTKGVLKKMKGKMQKRGKKRPGS